MSVMRESAIFGLATILTIQILASTAKDPSPGKKGFRLVPSHFNRTDCKISNLRLEVKVKKRTISSFCQVYTSKDEGSDMVGSFHAHTVQAGQEFSVSTRIKEPGWIRLKELYILEESDIETKRSLLIADHFMFNGTNDFIYRFTYSARFQISIAMGQSTRSFSVLITAGSANPANSLVLYLDTNNGGADSLRLLNSNSTVWARPWTLDEGISFAFPHCIHQNCVILQCRRLDAYGNKVENSSVADVISIEVMGYKRTDEEIPMDLPGNDTSDERMFATYQEVTGSAPMLGNTTCETFICPWSNVALTGNNPQTWIMVYLNGIPMGIGNPVFMRIKLGKFENFAVDDSTLRGKVYPVGVRPALYPVDAGGNKLFDLWDYENCGDDCLLFANRNASLITVNASCYADEDAVNQIILTSAENPPKPVSFIFYPRETCSTLQIEACDGLRAQWSELGCSGCTKNSLSETTNSSDCLNCLSLQSKLDNCTSYTCKWLDYKQQIFLSILEPKQSAICVLDIKYNGRPIVASPFSFRESRLQPGNVVLIIEPSSPSPLYSTLHEWNISLLSSPLLHLIATANSETSIQLALVLRDKFQNAVVGQADTIRSLLFSTGDAVELDPPTFDPIFKALRLSGPATQSGQYNLQVYFLPSLAVMPSSPLEITVLPAIPLAKNTFLLTRPSSVIASTFNTFYMQARDRYLNLVPSSDPFFQEATYGKFANGFAPGFRIWVVRSSDLKLGYKGLLSQSSLKDSIRGCPAGCGGTDPGFGSLQAAIEPLEIGEYIVKVQFCDPIVQPGGAGCLDAFDLLLLSPPQAPNPCTDLPTGVPGPRPALACDIIGAEFTTLAGPDRITAATVQIENFELGEQSNFTVLPVDRNQRNAALPNTTCSYTIEFASVVSGNCTYVPARFAFEFFFTPFTAGIFTISVYINELLTNDSPISKALVLSIDNYNGTLSNAIGAGIREARAGSNNSFEIYLRDHFGNLIPRNYIQPTVGSPYPEDCGYAFSKLPDGTETIGYGLTSGEGYGPQSGCRFAFQMYLVGFSGQILRPVTGFTVLSIAPLPSGSVQVKYTLAEPGMHQMYVRYLPYSNAGYILHDANGYLSLQAKNTSREGQIHGSPFSVLVHPYRAVAYNSRIIGIQSGFLGILSSSASSTYFNVRTRDEFFNYVTCNADEIKALILNPTEENINIVEIFGGTSIVPECRVLFEAVRSETYNITVNVRENEIPGSPYLSTAVALDGRISLQNTNAQIITTQTMLPCHEQTNVTSIYFCNSSIYAGDHFAVRISPRGSFNDTPDDSSLSFSVKVYDPNSEIAMSVQTTRILQGEHSVILTLTLSGQYRVSAQFQSSLLRFAPHGDEIAILEVQPEGKLDSNSTLLIGNGLTVATAGIYAYFSIFPRDKYGNKVYVQPSTIDPLENLPGRGKFQVQLKGTRNCSIFAAVLLKYPDQFEASYIVTVSDQYFMYISVLERAPTASSPSLLAVSKFGLSSAINDNFFLVSLGSKAVSNTIQPFQVTALPNIPSVTLEPTSLCKSGSFLHWYDMSPNTVVAGKVFILAVALRDACGNPSPALGNNIRAHFNGNTHDVITLSEFARNTTDQTLNIIITVSGWYMVQVFLDNQLLNSSVPQIYVLPSNTTCAENSIVLENIESIHYPRDDVSFFIQAKDCYGNNRNSGWDMFKVLLLPIDNQSCPGESGEHIKGQDLMNGKYYFEIQGIKTSGDHLLSILYAGNHIKNSPYRIQIVAGNMVPEHSFAYMLSSSNTLSPANFANSSNFVFYATGTSVLRLAGRDDAGLPTRRGIDHLNIFLFHSRAGNLTSTNEAIREQSTCTDTSFGSFCEAPKTNLSSRSSIFMYEIMQDDEDFISGHFNATPNSSCRSMSGNDIDSIVFSNTDQKTVAQIVQELSFNTTSNKSTIHNTSINVLQSQTLEKYNITKCMMTCLEYSCSCATFIEGTGTYADGSCFIFQNAVFLQFSTITISLFGHTALIPENVTTEQWYERKPLDDIQVLVSCSVPGDALLFIHLNAANIAGSPYAVTIVSGLFDVSASVLWITDFWGMNVTFFERPHKNQSLSLFTTEVAKHYTFFLQPKDQAGNIIKFDVWSSAVDIELGLTLQENPLQYNRTAYMLWAASSLLSTNVTMNVSGFFTVTVLLDKQLFTTAVIVENVAYLPCGSLALNSAACVVPCTFKILIPKDCFGNIVSVAPTFHLYIFDLSWEAYNETKASNLIFNVTKEGSLFEFSVTKAGKYQCVVATVQGDYQNNSFMTALAGALDTNSSSVMLTGSGIYGGLVNSTVSFSIATVDKFGNQVVCVSTWILLFVSINKSVSKSKPSTYFACGSAWCAPSSVKGGSFESMECQLWYMPALNISHHIDLLFLNQSLLSKSVQISASISTPKNISLQCVLISFNVLVEGVLTGCFENEILKSAGSLLKMSLAASDSDALPASFSQDLYIVKQYCATLNVLQGSCNHTKRQVEVKMNYSRVGVYDVQFFITASGRYWITLSPGSSFLHATNEFDVFAGPTDLDQSTLRGEGLESAVLDFTNTVLFDDKDAFGNSRVFPNRSESSAKSLLSLYVNWQGGRFLAQVEEVISNLGLGSFGTGTYVMTYSLPSGLVSPQNSRPCSLYSELVVLHVLFGHQVSHTIEVDLRCTHTFVPGFASVDPWFQSSDQLIYAGGTLSFTVIPKDQLGFNVSCSFERISVSCNQSVLSYNVHACYSSRYVVDLLLTASGTYPIFVLDGLVNLRSSPFQVKVLPDVPVPWGCTIFGHGLQATFLQQNTSLQATVSDRFGNLVSGPFQLISIFLTHAQGLENIQAEGKSVGLYEMFTFIAHFSGDYILRVYVEGQPATGGILDNGVTQTEISTIGNVVNVLAYTTDADKCFCSGGSLTLTTAGYSATFSVFARDSFGLARTYGDDIFVAYLIGPANISCAVRNVLKRNVSSSSRLISSNWSISGNSDQPTFHSDEYLFSYQATISGSYLLSILVAGYHVYGSPFRTSVKMGEISALSSQLIQDTPIIYYYSIVNLIPVSATASLTDGSFLRQVGYNLFQFALRDKFGNQADYNSSSQCCSSTALNITAYVVPQIVQTSGNAFLMSDEGMYIGGHNLNISKNSTNSSLSKNMSQTQTFISTKYFLEVHYASTGLYDIVFFCTAAGKYRIHVFVNGQQIARHIPIEEMQSTGANTTASLPDCCVPISGPCPASSNSGKVCGDLVTFIPSDINVTNTAIIGSSSKEFRFYVDGDGEGNKQYPVFSIVAKDSYGNVLTSLNVEFLVTIINMNGSTVIKQPAISVQPSNPLLVCRTSVLNPSCGKFEYSWTSVGASKSGLYKIQVTFQGIQIGENSSFITIRSREADSKTAQIFGPGIQVNLYNARSYFFFRVFDLLLNPWEPDCCLPNKPGPVNIDFGNPSSFGLYRGQRLMLNSTTADNRTRLFYLGFGLFKVEYVALGPIGPGSGSIQFYYGQSILAKTRPLMAFIPSTVEGGYGENSPLPLYPVANLSFATGSALYDHYAGDTVHVYVHAMSGFNSDPTFREGWWPSTVDFPGKYFVVEVEGPPGTQFLRFIPERETGEFPWKFHVWWTPTVSGDYTIFVEYDSIPVMGDSSTDYITMPSSPWQVRVLSAPASPSETQLIGEGISFATIGTLSSFVIVSKDVYGNQIRPENFNRFKEAEIPNGTLLGAWGAPILLTIQSQGDGSYLAFYMLTQSGSYALNVMMNGVAVRVPPKLVIAFSGKPSSTTSNWQLSSIQFDNRRCFLFPLDANPVPCDTAIAAGSTLFLSVEIRDTMNNSIAVTQSEFLAIVRVEIGGIPTNTHATMLYTGGVSWAASFIFTASGSYETSVLIEDSTLFGCPLTITVAASDIFVSNCFLSGEGLFSSTIMSQSIVYVHGRDQFGNDQSMEKEALNVSIFMIQNASLAPSINIHYGYIAIIEYFPTHSGMYVIIVAMADANKSIHQVSGSGTMVFVGLQRAPMLLRAEFLSSGGGILVVLDQFTDMGCVHGHTHSLCNISAVQFDGDCTFFFDDHIMQKLGSRSNLLPYSSTSHFSPECKWRSSQELQITLGYNASIKPGEYLCFLPKIRNENGTSAFVSGSIFIDIPKQIVVPIIILKAYRNSFTCSSIRLDPEEKTGELCRPVRYFWSVRRGTEPCTSITSLACSTFVERPELELNSQLISLGHTHVVLHAYNFLGGHSIMNITLDQSVAREKVLIGVDKGAGSTILSSNMLEIRAQVHGDDCYDTVESASFEWRISLMTKTSIWKILSYQPVLRVLPNTLLGGNMYLWQLVVKYSLNATNFQKIFNGTVFVEHSPLLALLAGGNSTVPSQNAAIILDASMSIDPDDSPYPPVYSWKCNPVKKLKQNLLGSLEVSDSPCFYDIDGLMVRNSSVLNLTGVLTAGRNSCSYCLPGVYRIILNFTKQPGDRWATAISIITISNDTFVSPVAGVLPTIAYSLDAQQRVKFDGIETSGADPALLKFEWKMMGGYGNCCSSYLNMSNQALFPSGIFKRFIIIKPDSFTPGAQYILRFNVLNVPSHASSFADLYINVNQSPHSGRISVSPSEGTAAQTQFRVSCEYWSDDPDSMPLRFEYKFVSLDANNRRGEVPLEYSSKPFLLWMLPASSSFEIGYFVVYIRNILGSATRSIVPVRLSPSLILSASEIMDTLNSTLNIRVSNAIQISMYELVFQYLDIASSLLNIVKSSSNISLILPNVIDSKVTEKTAETFSDYTTTIFQLALLLYQKADFSSDFMINKMLVSFRFMTAIPSQFPAYYLKDTMVLTSELLSGAINLQKENVQIVQAASDLLANVVNACIALVQSEPSQHNLAIASEMMEQVPEILQMISELSIISMFPGDEFVSVWTEAFVINSARVFPTDLMSRAFSVNSILPSQIGITPFMDHAIYSFPLNMVNLRTLQIKIKGEESIYGIYPYPRTIYVQPENVPLSNMSESFLSIKANTFGPVVDSQSKALEEAFIDIQISEWQNNPYVVQERNRTQVNEAAISSGQLTSFTCSSAFIDCSDNDHECVPPIVDGIRASSYRDFSCFNAFDDDPSTSWAVNPSSVDSPDGSGSKITLVFRQQFTWSILKYQQRRGPQYCRGSSGVACQYSTFNCTCIPGGDRTLEVAFKDGSKQFIELTNNYEIQEFYLSPVVSDIINITVISVYSNPRTCPARSSCPWWEPTCANWCPNGAASIEFITTFPFVQVKIN